MVSVKKAVKAKAVSSGLEDLIIDCITDIKGKKIVLLDLRAIDDAPADFFIVCEAGSQPQIRAIADNIDDKVRDKCGEKPFHHEGYNNLQWVLIDYVNVVVHVMLPENRKFYQLEEMWSDAAAETIED